ncbi:formylglycine-generating enzyme family protein [Salinibius halmophilus]|uniref:formylglycine-generating enzyme family protein n=1 Tax=Salinibius halmophilus TaxID=1853216 RepID=UPI000E674DBC|nr:SUMF1/EgtB/PvdO family nonheme iron enzyme [Salinibius halmophilus]
MKRNALLIATMPLLVSACFSGTSCEPNEQQICVDDEEFAEYLQGVLDNMVYVEPGEFIMGIDNGDPDEGPPVEIYLDGYYLHATKHSWLGIDWFDRRSGVERHNKDKFSYNPSKNFNNGRYSEEYAARLLYWDEANAFCNWLQSETGLPFELPSEAQWEKAGKAGNPDQLYPTDNGRLEPGRNIFDAETGEYNAAKLPSKKYPPNQFGFYEMAFNGAEWMRDGYVPDYHEFAEKHNPVFLPEDFNIEPGPKVARAWRGSWSASVRLEQLYVQNRKLGMEQAFAHSVRCALNTTDPLPAVGIK